MGENHVQSSFPQYVLHYVYVNFPAISQAVQINRFQWMLQFLATTYTKQLSAVTSRFQQIHTLCTTDTCSPTAAATWCFYSKRLTLRRACRVWQTKGRVWYRRLFYTMICIVLQPYLIIFSFGLLHFDLYNPFIYSTDSSCWKLYMLYQLLKFARISGLPLLSRCIQKQVAAKSHTLSCQKGFCIVLFGSNQHCHPVTQ